MLVGGPCFGRTPQAPSVDAKFLLLTKISYFDWTETFGECKVS